MTDTPDTTRDAITDAILLAVQLFAIPAPDDSDIDAAVDAVLAAVAASGQPYPLDAARLADYVRFRHAHGYPMRDFDTVVDRLCHRVRDPRVFSVMYPRPRRVIEPIPFLLPSPRSR